MIKEYDYLFKLVIVGNAGVGKSSLLLRFSDDQFNENYLTTLGVDFRFKTINVESKNTKLQIWDTAGQERFRTITNAYYKGAHGIVIVFDSTNEKSFMDIGKYWLSEIEQYGEANVQLMLIGNKCDLDDEKKVDTEIAQKFAKQINAQYFETSAKTAIGVNTAFREFAKLLMSKNLPRPQTELDRAYLTPNKDQTQNQTNCC